jgi:predicted small secreted protein
MMRRVILALMLAGLLFAAWGCNTVRGVGEDVSAAGNALSTAASGVSK